MTAKTAAATPEPTPVDIDRIALSHELLELAERFMWEAGQWTQGARAQLEHDARLLATIGRAVLTTADMARARAYAESGITIMRNVEAARRYLTGSRGAGRAS